MNDAVLDSSALLALLLGEPGADQVTDALPGALMSAANYAETLTKLAERGLPLASARQAILELGVEIIDLDADQAFTAADLRLDTREAGLSLGDRLCLALASHRRCKVLTADKAWLRLKRPGLPPICCIRTSPI